MLAVATTQAQKHHGVYAIGFYNLENLFDYTHDEGKKDEDFLPTGRYQWNQTKYECIATACRGLSDHQIAS